MDVEGAKDGGVDGEMMRRGSDSSERSSDPPENVDLEKAESTKDNHTEPKLYPPAPMRREDYVVDFDENDPMNPQNWPLTRKLYISAMCAYTCLCSTFSSAVWSPATAALSRHFGVSSEVGILATSLFLLGYSFGPVVFGPLSELTGRRLPLATAMLGFTAFAAGAATGKDLQTVLICRFFTGAMGSCPVVVVAGIFSDIYNHEHRGIAMAFFGLCVLVGPVMAPFIGGFTVNSHLGWRFDGYWCLIAGGLAFVLLLLFLPETFGPVILVQKASQLRKQTNNWAIYAKHETIEADGKQLVTVYFTRPIRMLLTEPVLFLVSFYMSFIYALLYLTFESYPLVFQGVYGWTPGVGGLPFFAVGIGVIIGCSLAIFLVPSYRRKLLANNGVVVPEWRLPQVMAGGVAFAIGLFWFGWTGRKESIHWIVPTLSGISTGFGIISVFMPLFNYILDTYLMFAASAIAANTLLRSTFAAGFPLFAPYMYSGLGIGLASTVLGCVAAALVPVPVVFYLFGGNLRKRSKFAPTRKP